MGVRREEQETNYQWSVVDRGMARIYTSEPREMRKLAKHRQARRVERHTDESGLTTGEEWEIPRNCIVLRNPRKTRPLSDTERRAVARRLTAARKRKDLAGVAR